MARQTSWVLSFLAVKWTMAEIRFYGADGGANNRCSFYSRGGDVVGGQSALAGFTDENWRLKIPHHRPRTLKITETA